MNDSLNVGVVGYGYWGPNIVRNFMGLQNASVKKVCDLDSRVLEKVKALYPQIEVTSRFEDLINDPAIDAVAIVTPVSTHFPLAKQALEAGKHIFVEKPFTANVLEAQELIMIAESRKLIIMVDHTFIFTGAVKKIKQVIDDGILGKLYYYDSTRVSLGLFQHDVNVIWDLAPHDFSIIDYVIANKPLAITAQGMNHINDNENLAYITMYFENQLIVHLNVNWLSPVKVRSTYIGGEKKMLVWDDLMSDEKIKIYDKGIQMDNTEGKRKLMVDYRAGDMYSPRVDHTEALKSELSYFIDCIHSGEVPVNDGHAGLRVVTMLAMAEESLRQEGKLIKFSDEYAKQ